MLALYVNMRYASYYLLHSFNPAKKYNCTESNKEAFERGVLSKRKAQAERSSLFISLLARVLPACLSQIHLTMRTGF
jgi:hypothetical protein